MATEKAAAESKEMEPAGAQPKAATATQMNQASMKVDTTSLKSTYCNVCSGTSSAEEVVLTFGVNQDWDMGPRPQEIQLHHRIILSPGAAKRLLDLMTKLVNDHDARHGARK
jgi:hypothetical protein